MPFSSKLNRFNHSQVVFVYTFVYISEVPPSHTLKSLRCTLQLQAQARGRTRTQVRSTWPEVSCCVSWHVSCLFTFPYCRAGYKLTVIDASDKDWWKGKCFGAVGVFPATYVTKLSAGEKPLQVIQSVNINSIHADGIIKLLRDQVCHFRFGRNKGDFHFRLTLTPNRKLSSQFHILRVTCFAIVIFRLWFKSAMLVIEMALYWLELLNTARVLVPSISYKKFKNWNNDDSSNHIKPHRFLPLSKVKLLHRSSISSVSMKTMHTYVD